MISRLGFLFGMLRYYLIEVSYSIKKLQIKPPFLYSLFSMTVLD